jgi:hypothetical protein
MVLREKRDRPGEIAASSVALPETADFGSKKSLQRQEAHKVVSFGIEVIPGGPVPNRTLP